MDDRYERGLANRRAVLGAEYVAQAQARTTPFDADFQRFITEYAWGEVWGREGLERKTRHLLTLALLAALGHEHELEMHLRATARTGVSPEEVREVFMQVAVYAGLPAANRAFAIAKEVLKEEI
ncbi:MAG: 4-carboxymuconolactone decarboxylase [Meiothermus sp.]|uniref:4-carboxymuconolactone decarboxylase n=1 Tax=Meiothermus sp. TaxID=1955249 RepID=UPI0025F67E9F|nr:4-carboxymuconolactone decarboxylase [Meiothermus sp.]MCS7057593.1 4-carboxymuconolactone decarboxylase [Meiothermus sp.]MCS7195186.1 4-carboxymuconolactone decarboxylase [Meiothermus sp.]MDW8091674.1 4-carboxymuconolactone decarboxylase [Meiothermus sp.]MDW8481284.1 4-carboxymuconolactone decarboxylase [Meiothermus sp.]